MYVIYIDVCMYIRATSKLVSSHVKEMRKIKILFCYKIKIIFLTSHICMYIYICKCVCVCVCVCVHIERKRDERVRGRGAAHVYVYVYVCVCVRVCMSEFVGEAPTNSSDSSYQPRMSPMSNSSLNSAEFARSR